MNGQNKCFALTLVVLLHWRCSAASLKELSQNYKLHLYICLSNSGVQSIIRCDRDIHDAGSSQIFSQPSYCQTKTNSIIAGYCLESKLALQRRLKCFSTYNIGLLVCLIQGFHSASSNSCDLLVFCSWHFGNSANPAALQRLHGPIEKGSMWSFTTSYYALHRQNTSYCLVWHTKSCSDYVHVQCLVLC